MKKAMAVRRCASSGLHSRGSSSANRPRRWWSAWATMALGGEKRQLCPWLTASPLGLQPHASRISHTTAFPAPGQQQDALQVGVGRRQPPPASSLLHAGDHHAGSIPSKQGLQGVHGAAGGGHSGEGSEGSEGTGPALTAPGVTSSPGVAVRWPSLGWGPSLRGVRGACALGQPVQLCDQREEEVWVEAPRSTHTARHSQHLPKGAGGLGNKQCAQVGAHCTQTGTEPQALEGHDGSV